MLLHCFLCLIAVMSFFREWDDRSFRRWGWGWECWAVASSTLSSFSGSAPSTSSASASSLVASSWEDRWRASLCTFWLNVMGWYFWDQASLSGQVLPNRTECGDGQGCNQPPAVFQKAVILLIGDFFFLKIFVISNVYSDALKYDFCLHNESLLSPKPYQVSHFRCQSLPMRWSLYLSPWFPPHIFASSTALVRTSCQCCRPCQNLTPRLVLLMGSFSSESLITTHNS